MASSSGKLDKSDLRSRTPSGLLAETLNHTSSVLSLRSMASNRASMPTVFNTKTPACKLEVKRVNWHTHWSIYFNDPFHTLLNMPNGRFMIFFFLTFLLSYSAFALVYLLNSNECVEGIHHFGHAFYFAVQTAATIGYGGTLTPNPDCVIINLCVTLQTIVSLMVDYSMLGLVYARFSSPMVRASSICFSTTMTMHAKGKQLLLSFRVANVRKKEMLKPEVNVLIAMEDEGSDPDFEDGVENAGRILRMQNIKVHLSKEAQASLWLGLPATVTHTLDETSPLTNISLEDMADRGMQILVMVDGIDKMTSNSTQARHCYTAFDIEYDSTFQEDLIRRRPSGRLTVDFSCFEGNPREMLFNSPLKQVPAANPTDIAPTVSTEASAYMHEQALYGRTGGDSLTEPLLAARAVVSEPQPIPGEYSQRSSVSDSRTPIPGSVFLSMSPALVTEDGTCKAHLPFSQISKSIAQQALDPVEETSGDDRASHEQLTADMLQLCKELAPAMADNTDILRRIKSLQNSLSRSRS